jgi:hypothetical protein
MDVFPARAPRKQSLPHRGPSSDDLAPGRVFTLAFGTPGSQKFDQQSYAAASHIDRNMFVSGHFVSSTSKGSSCGHRSTSTNDVDGEDVNPEDLAIQNPIATTQSEHSDDDVALIPLSSSIKNGEHLLANQYLDTMVMDDTWRALCKKRIRQVRRKQQGLKRLKTAPKPLPYISTRLVSRRPRIAIKNKPFFPVKSKLGVKSKSSATKSKPKTSLPTPPLSPKTKYCKATTSSSSRSDSGFISSSPTPGPPSYLRVRSTRNCPITPTTTTISIDIPISMIGRSCLSCGCTNTTCWRRTLGGIICNSCGLRCVSPVDLD